MKRESKQNLVHALSGPNENSLVGFTTGCLVALQIEEKCHFSFVLELVVFLFGNTMKERD